MLQQYWIRCRVQQYWIRRRVQQYWIRRRVQQDWIRCRVVCRYQSRGNIAAVLDSLPSGPPGGAPCLSLFALFAESRCGDTDLHRTEPVATVAARTYAAKNRRGSLSGGGGGGMCRLDVRACVFFFYRIRINAV